MPMFRHFLLKFPLDVLHFGLHFTDFSTFSPQIPSDVLHFGLNFDDQMLKMDTGVRDGALGGRVLARPEL